MSKRKTALLLVIISVAGSFETFYASNMIFSDVANAFMGLNDIYFIASIPALVISFDFVLAAIYTARLFIKPHLKKRMGRLYGAWLGVLSAVGLAAGILTGSIVYRSFTAPYPFPGYTILSIAVNAALLAVGVAVIIKNKKTPEEDSGVSKAIEAEIALKQGRKLPYVARRVNFIYVVHTILLFAMVFLAFNRFGALLWSPVYVQWRTLYITFPFYLWLLIPIGLLAHSVFYILKVFSRKPGLGLVNSILLFVINLALAAACIIIGTHNTLFISAISPALALERLAAMPVDTMIQAAGSFLISLYMLVFSIQYLRGKNTPFKG